MVRRRARSFSLEREETVIGRLAYCDVVLPQKNISRQHARLVRSGSEYFLEDMDSTNGTFLNGKRVRARTKLRDHDLIRVYDVTLLFRDALEAEVTCCQGARFEAERPSAPATVPRG